MIVNSKIDWISVTFPYSTKLEKLLPPDTEFTFKEIKSPIPVYKQAFEIQPIGAKLLIGDERLGKHMIYSGRAMTEIYELELPLGDLHRQIREAKGRLSRLDLAVDILECEEFTVPEVERRYFDGECETTFRHNKQIGENAETETFYFGKMNSKIAKCRVYNKGLEQGMPDYSWVRVEYEKRKNADNWFDAVMSGQSIKAMIKSSVDFPKWELWQKIFQSDDIGVIPREVQQDTTYDKLLEWIIKSAIPAMSKAMILEAKGNDKFSLDESRTLAIINSAFEYRLKKDLFSEFAKTHEKIPLNESD